jgi:hypothetical protein
MNTYFVAPPLKNGSMQQSVSTCTESSGSASVSSLAPAPMPDPAMHANKMHQQRLVNWVADLLQDHLRRLVATRVKTTPNVSFSYSQRQGASSLDEVAEAIVLPRVESQARGGITRPRQAELEAQVVGQLFGYVGAIAELYRYANSNIHSFDPKRLLTLLASRASAITRSITSVRLPLLSLVLSSCTTC